MKTYTITYINKEGNTVTTRLSAPNKLILAMRIVEDIKDIKDNNPDNIIAVEET